MQNQGSPMDKRPLFAQGVMYPSSPPASAYQSPGAGPQQHYAPNFSPRGAGPQSPFSSPPRFSTPVHSYQQRYPRESYGSPRSSWQHTSQRGYAPRQRFNSSRRSSGGGSWNSSWSESPYRQQSSPRAARGSYVKPSMVGDPWAELKDMATVKPPASSMATDTLPAADSDEGAPSDSAEPATEDS